MHDIGRTWCYTTIRTKYFCKTHRDINRYGQSPSFKSLLRLLKSLRGLWSLMEGIISWVADL